MARRRAGVNGVVNFKGKLSIILGCLPARPGRYCYREEGRMALIIKDMAIVAGLGLLYLMMVIVMIVIAIVSRE